MTVDRRTFLVSSLSCGFALAVSPASAQTITTDATGLTAGEVKIGQMPAYRAMPDAKDKKFPLVLVVQEIFGVHEHIKDLCRRLAKEGYLAIAPELFARQGDVSKMTDINEIITKVVAKVPDEQVMRDLDATVDWAKAQGKLDGERVAPSRRRRPSTSRRRSRRPSSASTAARTPASRSATST
jgi:carboxymethylenebutenolidase